MRFLLGLLLLSSTVFGQKISDLPIYTGYGDSAYVLTVVNGVNRKMYGKDMSRLRLDSLMNAINGKAATSHIHDIPSITNLQSSLDAKQATLVSGSNIKTINGSSVLGVGDITISSNPGTVTNVSFSAANGFTGSILNPTTTPAISVGTSITGLLKGNGTGVSAATAGTDYAAGTHTHAQTDITNLTTDLAAKAADNLVVHLANTETITGSKIFSAGASFTNNNVNFYVPSTTAATSSADSKHLLVGAAATNLRAAFGSNTSTTLNTGNAYGGLIVYGGLATEAASGSHPLASALAIRPLALTDGVATTANGATVYIEGPATGTAVITNNRSLWVDAGDTKLDGNLAVDGTTVLGTLSGILKGTSGTISTATAGTDYQAPLSLTTTGTSGAATLTGNTLNIPNYPGGTVTNLSVVSANGLAGTVATSTTTPAITLSTTVTGIVKGNGTSLSAAVAGTDYAAASHTHAESDITNLVSDLAAKQDASTAATITGTQTLTNKTISGSSNTLTNIAQSSVTDLTNDLTGRRSSIATAIEALGGTFYGETAGLSLIQGTASQSLASGTARLEPMIADKTGTVTGIRVSIATAGAYTANNFNGIALYTYSAGTLTQVAISANTGTLWTAAAGYLDIPFTATYNVTAGTLYFVYILYSSSAQTTAPALRGVSVTSALVGAYPLTNSAKLFGGISSSTTPPSTIAISTFVVGSTRMWAQFY